MNAHRDTIVILLKVDLDDVPLAVVDEINLVVSICTVILPLVPKSELVCALYTITLWATNHPMP
jgi:nuclear pore complex protein Nup205